MTNFAGRWFTTFGLMELTQEGVHVQGTYGQVGSLHGTVEGDRLNFNYSEPSESGQGWFELVRHGKFAGEYTADGAALPRAWEGLRGFDGIWESSFGRLRFIQEDQRVYGFYEGLGPATLEGALDETGRLVIRYQEPKAGGEAHFELAEDGGTFNGEWRQDGNEEWRPWLGRRILPTPGLTWLVVLEAHWQRSLADNEYAYGNMLREFFARLDHVKVRHRFFHDETSLRHWCRELLYQPEPTVLMIASHGSPEGLAVFGKIIDTEVVLEALRSAANVKLLHFSSCLVMQGDDAAALQSVRENVSFPISGYTTSVDWGGSALIEFTYLDLILTKRLSPAEAADKLPQLITFAGDEAPVDSPYLPAGFRFFGAKHDPGEVIQWAGM